MWEIHPFILYWHSCSRREYPLVLRWLFVVYTLRNFVIRDNTGQERLGDLYFSEIENGSSLLFSQSNYKNHDFEILPAATSVANNKKVHQSQYQRSAYSYHFVASQHVSKTGFLLLNCIKPFFARKKKLQRIYVRKHIRILYNLVNNSLGGSWFHIPASKEQLKFTLYVRKFKVFLPTFCLN